MNSNSVEMLTIGAIIEAHDLLEEDPEERGFRLIINDETFHGGTVFRGDDGRMVWTNDHRSLLIDELGKSAPSYALSDLSEAHHLMNILQQDIAAPAAGAAFNPSTTMAIDSGIRNDAHRNHTR